MHFAVVANNQEALATLLSLGANPVLSTIYACQDVTKCPKGSTALHLAARLGNETAAQQLLRAYVSGLLLLRRSQGVSFRQCQFAGGLAVTVWAIACSALSKLWSVATPRLLQQASCWAGREVFSGRGNGFRTGSTKVCCCCCFPILA